MKDHEDREDSIKSCTRFSISIGTLAIDVIVKPPKIDHFSRVYIYVTPLKLNMTIWNTIEENGKKEGIF